MHYSVHQWQLTFLTDNNECRSYRIIFLFNNSLFLLFFYILNMYFYHIGSWIICRFVPWWVPSRIYKGDHNVTRARGHSQSLVIVCQSSGMHQHPAWLRIGDGAIVSNKPASTAFVVHTCLIQGNVDSIGRGVVMWPQGRLLVRAVSYDEIHNWPWWLLTLN